MSEQRPPTPPEIVDWAQATINMKLDWLRKTSPENARPMSKDYRPEWVRDLIRKDIFMLRAIIAEQQEKIAAFDKRMKEGSSAEEATDQAGGHQGG